ncbi:glycoside hydrolase family 38 C-terminal domain-containing protein [Thermatribacter velox]|uniref:Glycoside hydrolase family 38 C-terminal domain-containing protein n=1 Tax=Thermatribacter velox TaxID=3039681 RepID=A0ABZ2Y8U6_9BACT
MKRKPTIHIVSHTHWDPEWYSPFREYQMRLVPLVDKLLKILEGNDRYLYFMFDGQVSALLNYLELKPENRPRIENLIKKGKLLVGPFYILPDEYMVSPEGIVRNILWGVNEAKKFGGFMPIAYLCDMAGHPSQMPQVLNLFGLDVMVAWRGVMGSLGITKSEFIWKGPDGKSKVLFLVMPFAYVNFGRLPEDWEAIVKIAADNIVMLSKFASTSNYLFMEGHDHQEPREDIPEIIDFLNKRLPDYRFIHSNLVKYADSIREELSTDIEEYEGELRATQTSFVLPGVLSSRIPLKKEIRAAEVYLERLAEPLCSLVDMMGIDCYPKEFLDLAWRIQFNNQFHDVIYGAHVDEVTDDALVRAHQVFQIAKRVAYAAGYSLANLYSRDFENNVAIVNPTPYALSGVFDFCVHFGIDESARDYVFVDESGNLIPFAIAEISKIKNYLSKRKLMDYCWKGEEIVKACISAYIDYIPPFGCKIIGVEKVENSKIGTPLEERKKELSNFLNILPSLPTKVEDPVVSGIDFMENSSLRLLFKNGSVFLEDKRSGKVYPKFGFIEDSGDRGDHYMFSPPEGNAIVTSHFGQIEKVFCSPLKTTFKIEHLLKIPKAIDPSRVRRTSETVEQKIKVFYTLRAGAEFVEIKVCFKNEAADHRLRIGFEVGEKIVSSEAEVFFDVVNRKILEKMDDAFWPEKSSSTKPKDRFVFVGDQEGGLLFVDQGWLKEYEISEDGFFYLTLLRCIGFLSVDSVPERSNAFTAPELSTPNAQYLEDFFEAEFVVFPLIEHWSKLSSYGFVDHFVKPLFFEFSGRHVGKLNSGMGLIAFNDEKILMSAFKKKENGSGWILRLWNPDKVVRSVELHLSPILKINKAFIVNALEERIASVDVEEGNVLLLEFKPKGILNVELCREEGKSS